MEGGDLSNEVPPRFLFVFEGLIGSLPTHKVASEKALRRAHRWTLAVNQWELNRDITKHLWDLGWRYNYRMDVVTFRGSRFGAALAQRLDAESLPISNVLPFDSPAALAQHVVYMPNVARVFTGNMDHLLTFGRLGHVVQDPRTFNPLA